MDDPNEIAHRKRLHHFENPLDYRYLTFSCYQRLPLLGTAPIRNAFRDHLLGTHERLGFGLYAWVIMPEHVHLLIDMGRNQTVPQILQALKQPFAMGVIRRWRELDAPVLKKIIDSKGRTKFWQHSAGYDRNLRFGKFDETVLYINMNPVRRGLVAQAEDWAWSSAGFGSVRGLGG